MKSFGRKHRPFFRICAMDARSPRDGRAIEELGSYDPQVPDLDKSVTLRPARIKYWQSVGAKASDNVEAILRRHMARWETLETEAAAKAEAAKNAPAPAAQ